MGSVREWLDVYIATKEKQLQGGQGNLGPHGSHSSITHVSNAVEGGQYSLV